jgi:hypothetical protein
MVVTFAAPVLQYATASVCRISQHAPDSVLLAFVSAAAPNTTYVPVPAHTGFAAYWENDFERTTPFPQVRMVTLHGALYSWKKPALKAAATALVGFTAVLQPRHLLAAAR